ncbi:hypothetical protein N7492_007837 [Penicillium capsulatum]|uniref:Uncharacterized protein n=1 Tax=Penicillium capsulatum TaxID=69766 RepID=A0A9W9I5Y6_9EURO|nr:hypothetical protein N7492_007837 [Penicillium capsulatum]KAJ6117668.1 hypothetical protein N7512_007393 [Penicillium capsulatum]
MSNSQTAIPGGENGQPQQLPSMSVSPEESGSTNDRSTLLDGKAATSVRAPRPAYLNWNQAQAIDPEPAAEDPANSGISGPTSPLSHMSSSEALRTPNLTERQRHPHKQPPSPGAPSQVPPRLHSPASQIFERDVQEDILPAQASPSVPAHIRTENYIPPVLEASSAAITDEQLNPDSVEIVTHSLHQPAAGGATGASTADQSLSSSGIVDHVGVPPTDAEEASSSYGALDTTDIRRLSFISFADVVNAEHAETGESLNNREHAQGAGTSGHHPAAATQNRSPSPLRSPASSHALGTSPPTSIATSFKGLETSPYHGARGAGSPLPMAQSPVSSNFGGDLNVETMRQALRRTGSGDFGGVASQAASTFGNDEPVDRSF